MICAGILSLASKFLHACLYRKRQYRNRADENQTAVASP